MRIYLLLTYFLRYFDVFISFTHHVAGYVMYGVAYRFGLFVLDDLTLFF